MIEAKKPDEKKDRGLLQIDDEECKGCGLCIEACPPKVIGLRDGLNHFGYRTATYFGSGCTGCGICYLVCPEPGAITVMRLGAKAAQIPTQATGGSTACASN